MPHSEGPLVIDRRVVGVVALAIAAVGLAGCANPQTPPQSQGVSAKAGQGTHVYTCADGYRFSVRVRDDSARVVLPTRVLTLPHVEAASGAKYAADSVMFWSKGEQATLDVGAATRTACRGVPAATPWEEARLLGVQFRAVGQEPGWTLDVDEERRLRFVGDYGSTQLAGVATEPPRASAGALTYRVRADGHDLTAVIRETPCQDAMSGEAYSHAVTVRVDGRDMQGCGRALTAGDVTNRYWKLTELNGAPAAVGPTAREAHLRLFTGTSRVAGSTGCNSLNGQFERAGDRLRFSQIATTRIACVDPGMARQEQELLRTLGAVDRFAVDGDSLTLYTGERAVARFAAVYLR